MIAIKQWIDQLGRRAHSCFYTIRMDGIDLLSQLKFEEFLYRKVAPVAENTVFFLTNNHRRTGSRAVVMGFSGREREFVKEPEKTKAQGVAIIRRFTGGGTVIVDECSLNTSFISSTNVAKDLYPSLICNWTYENLFKDSGIFNHLFGVLEGDFVVKREVNKVPSSHKESTIIEPASQIYKVAGNSQAYNRLAFVHHTVFPWTMSPLISQVLLHPTKAPKYRGRRDHASFLRSIKEAIDHQSNINSMEDFETALCERVGEKISAKMKRRINLTVSMGAEYDSDIREAFHKDTVLLPHTFVGNAIALLDNPITEML